MSASHCCRPCRHPHKHLPSKPLFGTPSAVTHTQVEPTCPCRHSLSSRQCTPPHTHTHTYKSLDSLFSLVDTSHAHMSQPPRGWPLSSAQASLGSQMLPCHHTHTHTAFSYTHKSRSASPLKTSFTDGLNLSHPAQSKTQIMEIQVNSQPRNTDYAALGVTPLHTYAHNSLNGSHHMINRPLALLIHTHLS